MTLTSSKHLFNTYLADADQYASNNVPSSLTNKDETLLYYAVVDDLDGVQKALQAGANINAREARSGDSAIALAIKGNSIDVLTHLIEAGADVNKADKSGVTPLMKAAFRGVYDACRLLLTNGAKVNVQGVKGQNALLGAIQAGHTDIVELLLSERPDMDLNIKDKGGKTPLMLAISSGRMDLVQRLVAAGADINAINVSAKEKDNPILLAIKSGDQDLLELLLEAGADVNIGDIDDRTPLILAAEKGNLLLTKTFIDAGANIEARASDSGLSALESAAKGGHLSVVELLLEKGAMDFEDKHGRSAESLATSHGYRTVAAVLQKWKKDYWAKKIQEKEAAEEAERKIKEAKAAAAAKAEAEQCAPLTPIRPVEANNTQQDHQHKGLDYGSDSSCMSTPEPTTTTPSRTSSLSSSVANLNYQSASSSMSSMTTSPKMSGGRGNGDIFGSEEPLSPASRAQLPDAGNSKDWCELFSKKAREMKALVTVYNELQEERGLPKSAGVFTEVAGDLREVLQKLGFWEAATSPPTTPMSF